MPASENSPAAPKLDPKLRSLLRDLRRRIRRYVALDSLLAALAVVLVLFWFGLLIDLVPVKLGGTEMPRSARIVLLLVAAGLLAYVALRLFLGRITRSLPEESLALLLERQHPELGGRLITSVQLSRPRQTGDTYSPVLLDRVHREAIARADRVDPGRIFRWTPVWSKAAVVGPLILAVVALLIISPATLAQASSRLLLLSDQPWPRQADLKMIGVEVPLVSPTDNAASNSDAVRLLPFEDKTIRIARGGAATLRVAARAGEAIVPDVCTVYYRTAGGMRGQVNMRRVGKERDGFQSFALDGPPLAGIAEDVTLSVRGLDDRLDGYRIEAVDPPSVTAVEIQARYPPYLRDESLGQRADLVRAYQPGLRVREGTTVQLVGRTGTKIARVEAAVTSGDGPAERVPVDVAPDGASFTLRMADVRSPTTVVLVPVDEHDISAPSPYRYFLGVISDSPPEIEFRMRGIGNVVTPQARLPVEGTATDDYGLKAVRVYVAPAGAQQAGAQQAGEQQAGEQQAGEQQAAPTTREVAPDRDGKFTTVMDLRDLAAAGQLAALEPGGHLNVYGEASDAYDLGEPHITRTDLVRLDVVTPEDLLASLERRELALRTRLEQTITETQALRDSLDLLRREGWQASGGSSTGGVALRTAQADQQAAEDANAVDRSDQLLRLRIQQSLLQANKTSQELAGIAANVDDILLEMINNRVDSVDRSERIAQGVRDPLRRIVDGPLDELQKQVDGLLPLANDASRGPVATAAAVQTTEEVLLQLNAVLERMLDLESYNEILDLVRGLIDTQEDLIEATEEEQTRKLFDL